ncbi:MAG: hypothetical protein AAB426_06375 [Myxococcota bacterium]
MIGSGGKIGGTPPGVATTPPQESASTPAAKGDGTAPRNVADQFERGVTTHAGKTSAPQALEHEGTGSAALLRMARENPQAARELVARFAQQATNALTQVQREMAAARSLIEQLAKERFAAKATEQQSRKLRAQREKLAAIKLRHQLAARKMALLQQLAGKLGDPRLDEELDRILSRHSKLKSGWGRRHDLLSLGESLYGDLPETPEHLKKVVRAQVQYRGRGEHVGERLEELSPRRIFSEIMARTIDGTTARSVTPDAGATRGELGRSVQVYGRFLDGIADDLDDDPFDSED